MDRNWDEVVATEQTAFDGWYGTLLRWAIDKYQLPAVKECK